ncbi:MAG: hypothetical protein RL653_1815 [Pseudomonadota bacterium]
MTFPSWLRALNHPQLRWFFAGQAVSVVGTWMQSLAMGWLVYRLTGSKQLLGAVAFLSQAPAFFLGAWGGSLADRYDRRRMLFATQVLACTQAAALAALAFADAVTPGRLLFLALLLGLSNAFEIPARHALLSAIAGPDTPNAVAINSTVVNVARVLGPMAGGYVVGLVGERWCFALNALSFLGVLYALTRFEAPPHASGAGGNALEHLRDGVRYAFAQPLIRALLLLVTVTSFCALPWTALMPVVARDVLGGDSALLGRLQATAGLGSLLAALLMLRGRVDGMARRVGFGVTALAAGLLAACATRHVAPTQAGLFLVGFGFIQAMAGTVTAMQGVVAQAYRGRVIGLFTMLFAGVTPFGALLMGTLAERWPVQAVLGTGAAAALLASIAFHAALPALRRATRAAQPDLAELP